MDRYVVETQGDQEMIENPQVIQANYGCTYTYRFSSIIETEERKGYDKKGPWCEVRGVMV